MKRFGNLWPNITFANGVQSIIEGTRFKRGHSDVQWLLYPSEAVQLKPELFHRIDEEKAREYAKCLVNKVTSKTWRHQTPKHRRQYCRNRASSKGKWRELYIPVLDDHIVAHMVMNASMEVFTRGMHPHCCGSVPGRGIKHVNRTVKRWMLNDKACRYFVKLDIRHFFDNIDRDILLNVLKNKIKDSDILWAFEQIIDSAPLACPIGYYTSPWFANLYLEKFDWFVEQHLYKKRRDKRIKYVRHYLRYVDDILLIGTSKNDLQKAVFAIREYLRYNYGLEIKDSWEIKAIGKHEITDWEMKHGTYWCDIGGYKFCKDSTVLRDGIFLSTRRLSHKMKKQGYYTEHQSFAINSCIGWASHCNSNNFITNDIEPFIDIPTTRRIVSDVGKIRKL